jgi:hypothetical protein
VECDVGCKYAALRASKRKEKGMTEEDEMRITILVRIIVKEERAREGIWGKEA